MNILKANRAINPSKINLSGEMLHFYFRAQSRLRHGLRPRSALRADPAGRGSFPPTRPPTRPADTRGSCTTPPRSPALRAAQGSWTSERGLCDLVSPWETTPASQREGGQPSPEQVVETPRFGRSSWAVRGDIHTHTHPPSRHPRAPGPPPPAGGAEVPSFPSPGQPRRRRLRPGVEGFGFCGSPGSRLQTWVRPWEAREGAEGGEPCPEPRSEPPEEN